MNTCKHPRDLHVQTCVDLNLFQGSSCTLILYMYMYIIAPAHNKAFHYLHVHVFLELVRTFCDYYTKPSIEVLLN